MKAQIKQNTNQQSKETANLVVGTFLETVSTKSDTQPDCDRDKGTVVWRWDTGDDECRTYSEEYECGAK